MNPDVEPTGSMRSQPPSSAEERLDALLRASLHRTYDGMARVGFTFIVAFVLLGVVVGSFTDAPGRWRSLIVPVAVGAILGLGLWLAGRGRLSRAWIFGLGFAAATVPGARMMVGTLWDPLMPAIFIHSPDVWLWIIIIVIAGIMLDRMLARALGIYCGAQNLALFAVARPDLATLAGDSALVGSVTSYEFIIARSLMIAFVGFLVGQHAVLVRELMRQIFVRLNTEEIRGIRAELARRQAQRSSEAKSTLLASIGHELRTPVNATLERAQAMLTSPQLDAPIRDGLRVIREGSEHLRGLIDDVMDASTVESDETELSPHDVHVRGLVRDVVGLMRLRAQGRGLALEFEIQPDVPQWVRADARRLRQVLLNLVGNAVKFTERGTIEIRVERRDEASEDTARLRFSVQDTGVGIAVEDVEGIFSPFVQAGSPAQRELGTGLGLAISQRLVQRMGGQIEVSSEPGVGSTFGFEISLPIASNGRPQPSTALPTAAPLPPLEQLRALRQLASDGRIKLLEQRLRSMAERDPDLDPFAEAMMGLTRSFEDEAILSALDNALREASADRASE